MAYFFFLLHFHFFRSLAFRSGENFEIRLLRPGLNFLFPVSSEVNRFYCQLKVIILSAYKKLHRLAFCHVSFHTLCFELIFVCECECVQCSIFNVEAPFPNFVLHLMAMCLLLHSFNNSLGTFGQKYSMLNAQCFQLLSCMIRLHCCDAIETDSGARRKVWDPNQLFDLLEMNVVFFYDVFRLRFSSSTMKILLFFLFFYSTKNGQK